MKILAFGKCLDSKVCLQRHPKDCKHWMGDTRGCLRGNECKYLHVPSKKGKNVKENKNYPKNENEEERFDDASDKTKEKKDKVLIDSLKKDVDEKDKELKQKDDKISELLSEKEVLLEENNRIKRCAKNMDQEIKQLRSRTN